MVSINEREREMLARLAQQDRPHFRHQMRGEPPLSVEEKIGLATDLLKRNPGEFLARFYSFLHWPEDAECFCNHRDDYTVRYYLEEVVGLKPSLNPAKGEAVGVERGALKQRMEVRVKNRRLMALRRMEAEAKADPTEGFFSHEQMRKRAPELWERMVGRYLSAVERRALLGHQYNSFSGMLLSQLLETEQMSQRLSDTSEEEDSCRSKERKSDRDRWRSRKAREDEEKERLRQEFREIMHSRFLAGLDEGFDYDTVDNDTALDDDMEERDRDAEESYFDSESPAASPS